MDFSEYRKDIEKRLAKTREHLEYLQNSAQSGTVRFGHEKSRDVKPMLTADCERMIQTYEDILKRLDQEGVK